MSGRYPSIIYTEEGMREGMQIEDANIPIDAKVALLDALSETGLKRIVVGRHLWGPVSRTRPRPTSVKALYDMNAPFVETLQQATHFKRGPEVYAGGIYPWKEPIASPYRERVEQGPPPFEVDGDWPWNEVFFPKPSTITNQDGQ